MWKKQEATCLILGSILLAFLGSAQKTHAMITIGPDGVKRGVSSPSPTTKDMEWGAGRGGKPTSGVRRGMITMDDIRETAGRGAGAGRGGKPTSAVRRGMITMDDIRETAGRGAGAGRGGKPTSGVRKVTTINVTKDGKVVTTTFKGTSSEHAARMAEEAKKHKSEIIKMAKRYGLYSPDIPYGKLESMVGEINSEEGYKEHLKRREERFLKSKPDPDSGGADERVRWRDYELK